MSIAHLRQNLTAFLGARLSGRRLTLVNLIANYTNTAFVAITGIVMVPLYLRYIGANVYGGWLATGSLVSVLGICDMGLNLIITQKLASAYAKGDDKSFAELAGMSGLFSLGIGTVLCLGTWGLAPIAPHWVNLNGEQASAVATALKYSAIGLGIGFCVQNVNGVFQALQAPVIPACLTLLSLLVGVTTAWLGLKNGLGVSAIGLSVALRSTVTLFLSLPLLIWLARRRGLPRPTLVIGRFDEFLSAGLPTLGGRTLGIVANNCQEFLVGAFVSPLAAASYSLTKRLPDMCATVLSPIGSSAFSALSATAGQDRERLRRATEELMGISTFAASWLVGVSMVVNRSFVTAWVGAEQFGGAALSIAIGVAIIINARFQLLGLVSSSQGLFRAMAFGGIAQSAVQLILLALFAYLMGPLGMPVAAGLATALIWGLILPRLLSTAFRQARRIVWAGIAPSLLGFAFSVGIGLVLPVQQSLFATGIVAIVAALLLGGLLLWLFPETKKMLFAHITRLIARWRTSRKT